MPRYDFECPNCNMIHEKYLRIAEMDEPVKNETECPHCLGMFKMKRLMPRGTTFIDPVRLGVTKPPSQFKEVLKEIHRRAPGSELGDKV